MTTEDSWALDRNRYLREGCVEEDKTVNIGGPPRCVRFAARVLTSIASGPDLSKERQTPTI